MTTIRIATRMLVEVLVKAEYIIEDSPKYITILSQERAVVSVSKDQVKKLLEDTSATYALYNNRLKHTENRLTKKLSDASRLRLESDNISDKQILHKLVYFRCIRLMVEQTKELYQLFK
jgi:hypothetical protein